MVVRIASVPWLSSLAPFEKLHDQNEDIEIESNHCADNVSPADKRADGQAALEKDLHNGATNCS